MTIARWGSCGRADPKPWCAISGAHHRCSLGLVLYGTVCIVPCCLSVSPEDEGEWEQGSKVAVVNVSPALASACSLPRQALRGLSGLGPGWVGEGGALSLFSGVAGSEADTALTHSCVSRPPAREQETQEGPSWGPLGPRLPIWGAVLGRPQCQAEEWQLGPGPQGKQGSSPRPHYQQWRNLDQTRELAFRLLPAAPAASSLQQDTVCLIGP